MFGFNLNLNFVDFYIRTYIGNELVGNDGLSLPVEIAIQQCSDICKNVANDDRPIKVVFALAREENALEFKNKKYIKMESEANDK